MILLYFDNMLPCHLMTRYGKCLLLCIFYLFYVKIANIKNINILDVNVDIRKLYSWIRFDDIFSYKIWGRVCFLNFEF